MVLLLVSAWWAIARLRSRILARLPGDDGILRKRKTAVLLATYLETTIGAISRPRSFLRERPVEPTKGVIRPKSWPRTSKIQIRRVLRNEGLVKQLCVWEPVPSAHGGLDASLAAAAAARRVMAEELAGCTMLMVAHRGTALADSNLRANMAWGHIRAVTKDRKNKTTAKMTTGREWLWEVAGRTRWRRSRSWPRTWAIL
ncbi:hypothetical protein MY10362_008914 [Beauveria mimosiformis]